MRIQEGDAVIWLLQQLAPLNMMVEHDAYHEHCCLVMEACTMEAAWPEIVPITPLDMQCIACKSAGPDRLQATAFVVYTVVQHCACWHSQHSWQQ